MNRLQNRVEKLEAQFTGNGEPLSLLTAEEQDAQDASLWDDFRRQFLIGRKPDTVLTPLELEQEAAFRKKLGSMDRVVRRQLTREEWLETYGIQQK